MDKGSVGTKLELHAKMYVTGHKQDVPMSKNLAKGNFQRLVQYKPIHSKDLDSVLKTMPVVWSTIPDTDLACGSFWSTSAWMFCRIAAYVTMHMLDCLALRKRTSLLLKSY